jgi:hypothetical protein
VSTTDIRAVSEKRQQTASPEPGDGAAELVLTLTGKPTTLAAAFKSLTGGRPRAGRFTETWYDTEDGRLRDKGFALRLRRDGEHCTLTLARRSGGTGESSDKSAVKAMALSPIDPMRYAMLSVRVLAHIASGDLEAACLWAERGALAPNAHVHISVIAALAYELAGKREAAERWATTVRRRVPGYSQKMFFESFPFRDEAMLESARAALTRLGL